MVLWASDTVSGLLTRLVAQYIVVFMVEIHYSDIVKMHSRIIREKGVGRVWRDPYIGFLMFSPSQDGAHGVHTLPPAVKLQQHVCNMSVQRSPLETLHLKVFTGGTFFEVYYVVCTYSLDTVSQPYQLGKGGDFFVGRPL